MTEPFPDDTPGRDATPEEEAHVRALLAALRDEDVPMPDHVWSRLSAVIAEEQAAAARGAAAGDPTALTDATGSSTGTTTGGRHASRPAASGATVVPLDGVRRRRGAPRWLLGAAAAVLVVLVGGALVKGAGTASSPSSAGGAMSAAAPSAAAVTAETSSGTAYTRADVAAQATALVSGALVRAGDALGASTPPGTGVEAGPATPSTATKDSAGSAPLLSGASLAACLVQLTDDPAATAVAVDRGSYQGQPADVVVVPSPGDPTHLDVWVLAPGCSRTSADVLLFERIARP